MVDVVLSTDELVVLGGPDQIQVELDYGPKGDRGSLIFVGAGNPNSVDIGQEPNVFDLYINLRQYDSSVDSSNEYLMLYQYQEALGTIQWQPLTRLIPNTYAKNDLVNFDIDGASYIPIASIVDPSYVGNTNASNFNVQVTFSTSEGYPIVSSIKTEVVLVSGIENLKITYYAKEFNGTEWTDISGSRTANLYISVV